MLKTKILYIILALGTSFSVFGQKDPIVIEDQGSFVVGGK